MQTGFGAHSPDGLWMWDGVRWIPAISPDGCWWWNGQHWTPLQPTRRRFWSPPWQTHDTWVLLIWLLLAPIVLAAVTIAIGLPAHLTPVGWLVASLIAYAAWAMTGGFVVRPRGAWWEVFVAASALVCLIGVVYVGSMIASPDPQGTNDNAAGVGIVFLVAFGWPPTLVLFAIGRAARRGLVMLRRDP
jgi:hypothetical protein